MAKRVLMMSHGITGATGFSNQLRLQSRALVEDGYEVYALHRDYRGEPIVFPRGDQARLNDGSSIDGMTMLPIGGQQWGEDIIPYYIEKYNVDYVHTLGDIWCYQYLSKLQKMHSWKWLAHYVFDTENMVGFWNDCVRAPDIAVVPSQNSFEMLDKLGHKNIKYVPHGINTNVFKPATSEEKTQFREELGIPNDAFVIGMVAHNQYRKKIYRLVESFRRFWLKNPRSLLILHCLPRDGSGWDLPQILSDMGLLNNVLFTDKASKGIGDIHVTENAMRKLYCSFDVHALSTGGEGFGVPSVEAMSCALPNVLTDYTCFSDDTTVLTPDGEKKFVDLKEGNLVFSKNMTTNKLEEKEIEKIIVKPYKGKMVYINSRHVNLLVTPDHKVITRELLSYGKWSDFKKMDAMNLFSKSHWKFPLTSEWTENEKNVAVPDLPIPLDDFLELAGWYLSEGFLQKDYRCKNTTIVTICEPQEKYRIEIKKLFERNNIKATFLKNRIVFNSKKIAKSLEEFGRGAINKSIPRWVKTLPREKLNIIFESVNKGDGSKLGYDRWTVYTTISRKLAIDIVELSLKLGIGAFIRTKKAGSNVSFINGRKVVGRHDVFRVNLRYKELGGHVWTKKHIKEIDYDGNVWCISVKDNANLLVGRNGRFTYCGNTSREFLCDKVESDGKINYANVRGITVPIVDAEMHHTGGFWASVDMNLMAQAFQYLKDNPGEGKQMGMRARKFAVENYDSELVKTKWKELYKDFDAFAESLRDYRMPNLNSLKVMRAV